MKKLFKTVFMVVIFALTYANFGVDKVSAQVDISSSITYQDFYDALSPYGNWIEYPGYQHVWSPSVDGDFRPYLTNGSWEYTDDGWAWASNYNWGWGPFHYGRWLYEPQYGWLWIPGYEWSPAWVTWGEVDDFYAWAPLYPGVNVGFDYDDWRPNSMYWNVVPRNHIYDRDVHRFAEDRDQINVLVNRIQTINNFNKTSIHNQYYSRGPEIRNVEKYTGRRITPASIKTSDKMMAAKREGNTLEVYRPKVVHPQPEVFKRMTPEAAPVRSAENARLNSNERANLPENKVVKESQSMNNRTEQQNREQAKVNSNERANLPQNKVVKESQSMNNRIEEQNREQAKVNSMERSNPNENMGIRNSEAPRIQNRVEERMPSVDRGMQRQNIERMPEMRSPSGSFERKMSSGSGVRRRN